MSSAGALQKVLGLAILIPFLAVVVTAQQQNGTDEGAHGEKSRGDGEAEFALDIFSDIIP